MNPFNGSEHWRPVPHPHSKWMYGSSPFGPAWYHASQYSLFHGAISTGIQNPNADHSAASTGNHEEEEIRPTEDLMREHGVLNRLLLVYEEGIRRILAGEELPPDTLQQSARLIRDFVEDYHEKLEEQWIFPRFERAGQHLDLVNVLLTQHQRGRMLTDTVLNLSRSQEFVVPERRLQLAQACALFSRMYRPHEAREDTVLFPKLRKIVSANEFAALGEQFERQEHQRFGEDGFQRIVDAVANIEKRLGIHNLAQYTP